MISSIGGRVNLSRLDQLTDKPDIRLRRRFARIERHRTDQWRGQPGACHQHSYALNKGKLKQESFQVANNEGQPRLLSFRVNLQ